MKSLFADAAPGALYFGASSLSIHKFPLFRGGSFGFLSAGFGSLGAKFLTAYSAAVRKFFC